MNYRVVQKQISGSLFGFVAQEGFEMSQNNVRNYVRKISVQQSCNLQNSPRG